MSSDATAVRIGKVLKTAAAALGRSFECAHRAFWPASGDNDIAERHLTHHLAAAFAAKGYQPYFEVARKGRRLDLVLVKWRKRKPAEVIAVEAKLLYSADGRAGALARDVRKLSQWSPKRNTACLRGTTPTHRMVIASMWTDTANKKPSGQERRDLVNAWRSATELKRMFSTNGWNELTREADKVGASFLHSDAARYGTQQQHLLAVLWSDAR